MAAGWISMRTVMQHIKQANWKFRKSESSLNDLISLLGGSYSGSGADKRDINAAESLRIEAEIRKIKTTKLLKYQRLLRYIGTQLDIDSFAIPINPIMRLIDMRVRVASLLNPATKKKEMLNPGCYLHVHEVSYESSNGDLKGVFGSFDESPAGGHIDTRERVWYPHEQPTDAPFSNVMRNVPLEFFQPLEGGKPHDGKNSDDHSTVVPEYIIRWPVVLGRVRFRQQYQYKLPERDGWKDIPGAAYEMEKGVRIGKNRVPAFYFSKKNWADHNTTPFHFEVEYDIGTQPAQLPDELPRVAKHNYGKMVMTASMIFKYGGRVISEG